MNNVGILKKVATLITIQLSKKIESNNKMSTINTRALKKLFIVLPLFFLMMLFAAQPSYAQEIVNTRIANSDTQSSSVQNSSVDNSETAQDFNLSQKEWARYQQLMHGDDGFWYKKLPPAMVLGINARTSEEKEHYAKVVAKEEHDRLASEISFNNAVYNAMLKLYPNEPIVKPFNMSAFNPIKKISLSSLDPSTKNMTVKSGDHLVLFVDTNEGLDFTTLPKLLAIIKTTPNTVLDIYAVGKIGDGALRSWAALNAIPVEMVNKGQITLNHNNGKLQQLVGSKTSLPYVLLVRDGQSAPVNAWSLI